MLDEQREIKAEQKERREEQLFSISLYFLLAWLSLSLPYYHLFSLYFVRCGNRYFQGLGVYSVSLLAERRKERDIEKT